MSFSIIQRCMNKIKKSLAHPSMIFVAAGLGVLCLLPTTNSGWYMDDYWHVLAYQSAPVQHELTAEKYRLCGPMKMFAFLDGSEERNHKYMDIGGMPWWSYEYLKASFWRPVAVLTYELDYWLWPTNPHLMHLHSLCWYVMLILASSLFFKRFFGSHWSMGIVALLYALNVVHLMPVSWLANRHTMLATLFGILSLYSFDRWRMENSALWGCVSVFTFLLSLLSNESGVVIIAFFFAYTIFIETTVWKEKIKTILPYIVIIILWRLVYNLLGYGAVGSGLYIDPIREPLRFLSASAERVPILLWGIIGWPPSDLYMLFSDISQKWYAAVSFLLLFFTGWILYPFWKENRLIRFWGVSLLLSSIPLCAAVPSNRNMALPSLAAVGLLGQSLQMLPEMKKELLKNFFRRYSFYFGIAFVFLVHFLLAPAGMINNPKTTTMINSLITRFTDIKVPGSDLAQKDIIVVNAPCSFGLGYLLPNNLVHGLPVPAHIRILSAGSNTEILRVDEKTLVVRPEGGYLKPVGPGKKENITISDHINVANIFAQFEKLTRDDSHPMRLGQKVELTGVTIEITAMNEGGRPAEATFRFAKPLEDASMVWLQWIDGYEKFTLPAIGEKVWVDKGKLF